MNFLMFKNLPFDQLIVPLILILADIVSGVGKAIYHSDLNSTRLKHGLISKSGEVLLMCVFLVLCYFYSFPNELFVSVVGYIVVMEIVSIMENLKETGVSIPKWLDKMMSQKLNEEDENVTK